MWGRGTLDVIRASVEAGLTPPTFTESSGFTYVTFHVQVGSTTPAFPPITPEELRAARHRAGWTQEELANRLGTTASALSHWERKKKSIPADRQQELARIFALHRPK